MLSNANLTSEQGPKGTSALREIIFEECREPAVRLHKREGRREVIFERAAENRSVC
jgi:hypothetical protein